MRNEIVSPPRVGGLHETILNPAGWVDENIVNRFTPLSSETEDNPATKSARLKPILEYMARGVPTSLSEPCEESVCVDRVESKAPPTENDAAPPASQMTALPPNKEPVSQPARL